MCIKLHRLLRCFKTALLGFCFLPFFSFGATLSIEVYRYSQLTQNISDSTVKINLYVDGNKVLSEKSCPYTEPCKIEIPKKSVLTICGVDSLARCQTGVAFDPSQSPNQRIAILEHLSAYAVLPYTVFSPIEFPALNDYLQKQLELEKQRDEIKARAIN